MEKNYFIDLSVESVLSKSWELTKKHFVKMLVITLLMVVVTFAWQSILESDPVYKAMATTTDPERIVRLFVTLIPKLGLGLLVSYLIQAAFYLVQYRMQLDAVNDKNVSIRNSFNEMLPVMPKFIILYLLTIIIVALATACCVLPGIYLMVRFMFVLITMVENPKMGIKEAFVKSWNLTSGHFGSLFLLGVIAVLLNLLGVVCCVVGVIVTTIISSFMLVVVYKRLSGETEQTEVVVS